MLGLNKIFTKVKIVSKEKVENKVVVTAGDIFLKKNDIIQLTENGNIISDVKISTNGIYGINVTVVRYLKPKKKRNK